MSDSRNTVILVATRAVVSLVLLIIGIAVYVVLVATQTPPASSEDEDRRPHIAVMRVRPVEVRRQFEGFGTAEAYRAVNVPAQVRGVVQTLPEHIVPGNRVEQGQLLVQLDQSDFQREVEVRTQQLADIEAQLQLLEVQERSALQRLELAEQEVQLAQADLDRVIRAQETAGATQREVDQQRQALAARQREQVAAAEAVASIDPRHAQLQAARLGAESSLRLARRNLERTTIRSPITGVLESVDAELGETLAVDQTVARVVNLQRVDVPIRLPASAREHLAIGNTVSLAPAGGSFEQWQGQVARISPEVDEATRTMTVFVEFRQDPAQASNDTLLWPGLFLRARVHSDVAELRQVIPRRALAADRIRLVEDGMITSRRVEVAFEMRSALPELGVADDHWLILRDPLPEDALVVLNGARRIADGTAVQPDIAQADVAAGRGEGALP